MNGEFLKKKGRTGGRNWSDTVENSMWLEEETIEEQTQRIAWYTKKKVEHFTEQGRVAEISVDLELQAKALLSDNKVSGPEDNVVSEMIKQLPLEKFT